MPNVDIVSLVCMPRNWAVVRKREEKDYYRCILALKIRWLPWCQQSIQKPIEKKHLFEERER